MATAAAAATAPVAADIPLSDQQRAFFGTFGYIQLPGAIADVIGDVQRAFEEVWQAHGGGQGGRPHDGKARSCIFPFIDEHADLSALLDHPRVHGALVSLLGEDFNYMGSDGNYYVGDTGWHPDGMQFDLRFVKVAVYLDELDGGSGALRVVPGSHLPGPFRDALVQRVGDSGGSMGVHGRDVPATVLATRPGDLAIFDHNTFHSAWNGGARRRMFTLNCCQRWPQERLGGLREYIASHARFLCPRQVGPAMLATASPQRMRHLEQPLANDGLMVERVRELRAAGADSARG